ncbi:MAG: hypothetical protein LBB76_11950 [Azoarcus sp.]|nr:hypothetical protein [Azoarcus sp.]
MNERHTLHMSITTTLILALTADAPAHAQVYRCTSTSGAVEYSQTPCSRPGDQSRIVRTDDALSGTDTDAVLRQVDASIQDALANRDYRRAEIMAVTREQRERVNAARNADPDAAWQAADRARRAAQEAEQAARDAQERVQQIQRESATPQPAVGLWYPGYGYGGRYGQYGPYPSHINRPYLPAHPSPPRHPQKPSRPSAQSPGGISVGAPPPSKFVSPRGGASSDPENEHVPSKIQPR